MNAARATLSFTLVCAAALLGCTTPDTEEPERPATAQAELKGTYGYELFADRLAGGTPESAAPPPAEVSGRVAPEIALDVLRSSLGALRACERQAIERGETPPGELRSRLVIGEDGRVARVTTDGSPRELGACAQRALGALRFPRSTGGSFEIVYPVLLGAGG